jgi:L-rhamnose isomerase
MENNKNIWLLPTNEPSRLHLWTDEKGKRLELCDLEYSHTRNIQHIYITSDEEIRRDDLCMDTITKWIFRATRQIKEKHNFYQKIVLADDPKLIVNGVQPIPDEFLEWFIKNPSCERVEVEIVEFGYDEKPICEYKIIIPKVSKPIFMENKTPMQELIEQLKTIKNNNCKTISEVIFFDGILAVIEAGKYLEKEKQVIEDTYYQGFSDKANDIYGKDYYNEKFNNNGN